MTLLELLDRTTRFFGEKAIPSPRLQAELLTSHVLGKPRLALYLEFDRPMQEAELEPLRALVRRRAQGEPLQYILGKTSFCGLEIQCAPGALIPRPETEYLVERVVDELKTMVPGTLADIGTGTGCIALACSDQLPGWNIWAVESSQAAVSIARRNLLAHPQLSVALYEGSLLDPLPAAPQVVAANLPYLNQEEMESLPPDVQQEPTEALNGGTDGLEVIRRLVHGLSPETRHCFLETGIHHTVQAAEMLREAGYFQTDIFPDPNGHPRYVVARR